MQGITKGTVLGHRYELTSQVSDAPGLVRWLARDEKLGRDVAITVVGAHSAHAEAALDSARRAAGVDDPRLVRVLDAGVDDDVAYIVEEPHTGAHNLADLVRFEPIHPEEARRIVGETASALEAARQRGLHHLILSPRHVLRLADGSIAVSQVAVGSALAGRDDVTSAEATATDTHALVHLLYAALTGLWAGDAKDVEGLKGITPADRRADGQIATPGELVDGIPNDLEALCRQVLNHDEGPRTPGEVARQLAPWSAQMITAPGKPHREAGEQAAPSTTGHTVRRAADTAAAKRAGGVGAVGAAALAAAGSRAPTGDGTDPGMRPAAPRIALPRKPAPRRVSAPEAADATMIGRPVEFDADDTTQFTLNDEDHAYTRTSYDPSFEELEPPVPGFHGGTEDPDAASSKLALVLVGLIVVAALVLAVLGLKGISGGSSDKPAASPLTSSGAPEAPAAPGEAASSAPSPSAAAPAPVDVIAASFVNKRGYRVSETASVAKVIDGDPSTEWKSLHYRNQAWGGYPGYGGLALNLGTSTPVKKITITPSSELPLTADVYVGDTPGTTGTKVGSVADLTAEKALDVTATGRYVTIFITAQGKPAGKAYYQSTIAEVTVEK